MQAENPFRFVMVLVGLELDMFVLTGRRVAAFLQAPIVLEVRLHKNYYTVDRNNQCVGSSGPFSLIPRIFHDTGTRASKPIDESNMNQISVEVDDDIFFMVGHDIMSASVTRTLSFGGLSEWKASNALYLADSERVARISHMLATT